MLKHTLRWLSSFGCALAVAGGLALLCGLSIPAWLVLAGIIAATIQGVFS